MAIKSKVDFSFTTTPPRDLLVEISKSKNKNPLPQINYHSGIRLPGDRFCLHAQNYALKTPEIDMAELQRQQQQQQKNQANQAASNLPQFAFNSNAQQQSTNLLAGLPAKRRRDDEDDYDM